MVLLEKLHRFRDALVQQTIDKSNLTANGGKDLIGNLVCFLTPPPGLASVAPQPGPPTDAGTTVHYGKSSAAGARVALVPHQSRQAEPQPCEYSFGDGASFMQTLREAGRAVQEKFLRQMIAEFTLAKLDGKLQSYNVARPISVFF
jgi:hypothetical protein